MFLYLSGEHEIKGINKLHFLWKDETRPIYIMDEHQAALFCWLCELVPADEYTLFHIDHHWDATDIADDEIKALTSIDLTNIDNILELRIPTGQRLLNYTNYMYALSRLRPNLIKGYFAADQDRYASQLLQDPRVTTFHPEELINNLDSMLVSSNGKILINIDFDFLFHGIGKRAYPDVLLIKLLETIKPILDSNIILTAAWTPFLCGGCKAAADICKILCDILSIECPTESLPYECH